MRFMLYRREGAVGGVGLRRKQGPLSGGIEAPHQERIGGETLGGCDILDGVALPETPCVSKGGQPALRGNPGSAEGKNPLCGVQPFSQGLSRCRGLVHLALFLSGVVLLGVAPVAGRAADPAPTPGSAPGYITELRAERPSGAAIRHARVARRRAGPAVIVHRGAAAFAPENTLEAYAAAMDYGADGCEIDIRRTSDGVLALFHDDMLDHLTNGFGGVEHTTYYELLSLRRRFRYGRADADTRPPTLVAVLQLARQRAMLLHLDIKQTGLDAELADLFTRADMWDHIVAVNASTAPTLARDSRVRPLPYKGPGLYDARRDVDPESVRAQLARPGSMVMVDDPRLTSRALSRPVPQVVPLPEGLRQQIAPRFSGVGGAPRPFYFAESVLTAPLPRFKPERVLTTADDPSRSETGPDPTHTRARAILERALAAQRWEEDGRRTRSRVGALVHQLEHRSLHRNWMFHGLDGASAARALGVLGAVEAAPVLTAAFRRVDPLLEKVKDPQFTSPVAWTDFRTKLYILPALGDLPCEASKSFLKEYLSMSEGAARELAPLQFEEATRSYFRQKLTREEVETALTSPNTAVRGTAVLICLDEPTALRTAALRARAPWALELPSAAQDRPTTMEMGQRRSNP